MDGAAVFLVPKSSLVPTSNALARVEENGTFKMPNVFPAEYNVVISNLPAGHYLKDVRMGNTDVREDGIDLTPQGATGIASGLEITISPGAARVSGEVTDANGKPVRNATVVLRPAKGVSQLQIAARSARVPTDPFGKFNFAGVAPGEYLLLALDGVDVLEIQDPDVFKEYESKATRITLRENSAESQSLRAVAPI